MPINPSAAPGAGPDLTGQGIGFTIFFRDQATAAISSSTKSYDMLKISLVDATKSARDYITAASDMFKDIGKFAKTNPDVITPFTVNPAQVKAMQTMFQSVTAFYSLNTQQIFSYSSAVTQQYQNLNTLASAATAAHKALTALGGAPSIPTPTKTPTGGKGGKGGGGAGTGAGASLDVPSSMMRTAGTAFATGIAPMWKAGEFTSNMERIRLQITKNVPPLQDFREEVIGIAIDMKAAQDQIGAITGVLIANRHAWDQDTKNMVVFAEKMRLIAQIEPEAAAQFAHFAREVSGFKTSKELEGLGSIIRKVALESRASESFYIDFLQQNTELIQTAKAQMTDFYARQQGVTKGTKEWGLISEEAGRQVTKSLLAVSATLASPEMFGDPEEASRLLTTMMQRTSEEYIKMSQIVRAATGTTGEEWMEMFRKKDIAGMAEKLAEAAGKISESPGLFDPGDLGRIAAFYGTTEEKVRAIGSHAGKFKEMRHEIEETGMAGTLFDQTYKALKGTFGELVNSLTNLGNAIKTKLGFSLQDIVTKYLPDFINWLADAIKMMPDWTFKALGLGVAITGIATAAFFAATALKVLIEIAKAAWGTKGGVSDLILDMLGGGRRRRVFRRRRAQQRARAQRNLPSPPPIPSGGFFRRAGRAAKRVLGKIPGVGRLARGARGLASRGRGLLSRIPGLGRLARGAGRFGLGRVAGGVAGLLSGPLGWALDAYGIASFLAPETTDKLTGKAWEGIKGAGSKIGGWLGFGGGPGAAPGTIPGKQPPSADEIKKILKDHADKTGAPMAITYSGANTFNAPVTFAGPNRFETMSTFSGLSKFEGPFTLVGPNNFNGTITFIGGGSSIPATPNGASAPPPSSLFGGVVAGGSTSAAIAPPTKPDFSNVVIGGSSLSTTPPPIVPPPMTNFSNVVSGESTSAMVAPFVGPTKPYEFVGPPVPPGTSDFSNVKAGRTSTAQEIPSESGRLPTPMPPAPSWWPPQAPAPSPEGTISNGPLTVTDPELRRAMEAMARTMKDIEDRRRVEANRRYDENTLYHGMRNNDF